MQRFGRAGLGVLVAQWAALAGAAVEQAEAQTSTGQAANSGPSTDQVFNEALEKTDEFEAFGWPPKGRFTISPEFTNDYVEFNRRLWNNYGILYVLAPTVMMQKGAEGRTSPPTNNTTDYSLGVSSIRRGSGPVTLSSTISTLAS